MKQPLLKICPATNGLPTRMSKTTWEKQVPSLFSFEQDVADFELLR